MLVVDIVVPVLWRPQNVKPLLDSIAAATEQGVYRVLFVVDESDNTERAEIDRYRGALDVIVTSIAVPDRTPYARKINEGYRFLRWGPRHLCAPWIFQSADDLAYRKDWLPRALEWADEYTGVIGTNDLCNGRVMRGVHSTHSLVRRDYVDTFSGVIDEPRAIMHEGYGHEFCNPPEASIWMGDLSFRPLGAVKVGDEVIGWTRESAGRFSLNRLGIARVEALNRRRAPLVRVEMESGRSLRCTPDHRWANAAWSPSSKHNAQWVRPEVGRQLLHVVDKPPAVPARLERLAGWVGGVYDGEGSWIQISQSPEASPVVCAALAEALSALDIPHTLGSQCANFVTLTGGRQAYLDFLHKCQPVFRTSIVNRIIGGSRFGHRDRIVAVEPAGQDEVFSMTTSTGNYVAWGYASRNCDDELVQTAKFRGAYVHAFDSIVEHRHPNKGRAEIDRTYLRGQEFTTQGRQLFELRKHLWTPQ